MNFKKTAFMLFAATSSLILGSCQTNEKTMAETNTEKDTTTVIDAIMSRRSIRYYKDTPVEHEKLQKIAECGLYAPNAMNKQEWEVRIIDNKEFLDGVTELMKEGMPGFIKTDDPKFRNGFRNATALIAVACPDDPMGMTLLNVGLMGENMCLAAQDLGLGTCVMCGPSVFLTTNEKAKPYLDRLQFSEGYKLRYVIGVGYPDETPVAKPRDLSKIKFVE